MSIGICHADADANANADTNGIRTETNMSPLTCGGGHKNVNGGDFFIRSENLSYITNVLVIH